MDKEEFRIRNLAIAKSALSNPIITLQQLSAISGVSGSQIGEILSRLGIKKEKGIKGLWKQTSDYKKPSHIRVLNPKKRGRKPDSNAPSKSSIYKLYQTMKSRCYNPKVPNYNNYGGRGITICDRWLGDQGFKNFVEDMGQRPQGRTKTGLRPIYTIERKNNNLDYSKDNCIWATYKVQNNNSRPQERGAKLSYQQAQEIREMLKRGFKAGQLALMYHVSDALISNIVHNKIWKERLP